jgi:uncharacterized protein YggE
MKCALALASTLLCLLASRAAAQYEPPAQASNGITVYGTGERRTRPHMVEIDLRASASAELTADALVKYRDTKRRTLEAFQQLQFEQLSIEEQGLTLTPGSMNEVVQRMWGGMPPNASAKAQVQISSMLRLRLDGIRDKSPEQVMEMVGKLLDVAQDSGSTLGPSQEEMAMAWRYGYAPTGAMVRFVVRDLAALREEAYELAVSDARSRAERLARLNGVKLGPVLSVQELEVSGDESVLNQPNYPRYNPPAATNDGPQITSESFAEIPFRVKLLVRFSIEPENPATAQN